MNIAEIYTKLKRSAAIAHAGSMDALVVREEEIIDMIGADGLELMVDNHLIFPYGKVNNSRLFLLS